MRISAIYLNFNLHSWSLIPEKNKLSNFIIQYDFLFIELKIIKKYIN